MILKHDSFQDINQISSLELVDFYSECRFNIDQCLSVINAFKMFDEGALTEDELLEEMECGELTSTDTIRRFCAAYNSVIPAINHYLIKTVSIIDNYNKNLSLIADTGCYPDAGEIKILNSYCYDIVASLAYTLYHEFGLGNFVETYAKDKNNYDIDEVFREYVGKNNLDTETQANFVIELMKVYKIKLEIFDEYPELESKFEELMGPHLATIEEDQSKLTIELVNDLIDGKIMPEDLCQFILGDKAQYSQKILFDMNSFE